VRGQKSPNAGTFTTVTRNVSSTSVRPRTSAFVAWTPPDWDPPDASEGFAGVGQRTPNLKTVIEEIVAPSTWSSGNALVLFVTGSGKRVAESWVDALGGGESGDFDQGEKPAFASDFDCERHGQYIVEPGG